MIILSANPLTYCSHAEDRMGRLKMQDRKMTDQTGLEGGGKCRTWKITDQTRVL